MGQKARDRRAPQEPRLIMSDQRLDALIQRSCLRKVRYHPSDARWRARRLTTMTAGATYEAYACPFADDGGHWHVGHALSVQGLEDMARGVRAHQQRRGRVASDQ